MSDDLRQKAKTYRQFGDLRAAESFDWAADYIEKLGAVNDELFSNTLQLYARIEKLEAALRVYADEDHWFGDKFEPIMFPEGECKCCYEHFSDQGEIARKALEGKDD